MLSLFHWAPDVAVFWDIRAVQHYASSDYWPRVHIMQSLRRARFPHFSTASMHSSRRAIRVLVGDAWTYYCHDHVTDIVCPVALAEQSPVK
jgi:hypothetical protein